jgi:hypothetical protein
MRSADAVSMPPRATDRRQGARGAPRGEPDRSQLTALIVASFREMPGMTLRLEQAARLFGLRARTCEVVLGDLVRQRQLRRRPDGQYTRSESEG